MDVSNRHKRTNTIDIAARVWWDGAQRQDSYALAERRSSDSSEAVRVKASFQQDSLIT